MTAVRTAVAPTTPVPNRRSALFAGRDPPLAVRISGAVAPTVRPPATAVVMALVVIPRVAMAHAVIPRVVTALAVTLRVVVPARLHPVARTVFRIPPPRPCRVLAAVAPNRLRPTVSARHPATRQRPQRQPLKLKRAC